MAFPSLIRLTLSITLTLSSFVFSVICFTPPPRFGQTSALFNNQIYYMGGEVPPPKPTVSDFFYLDTSTLTSTDPSTLPWSELTGDNLLTSWGTAVAGGANNDLFVLFGGRMISSGNADNSSLVIVYSTSNNTWLNPQINTSQYGPTRRRQTQAVIDSTGKMYIFGGSTSIGFENPSPVNSMDILDTVNWSWNAGTGGPDARFDFSATILSNGFIVYIGGSDVNDQNFNMSQINIYDTNSDAWTSMVTTGDVPGSRGGHSAVLTSDGRIIIYGGVSTNGQYAAASPDIAVLDTTNNSSFVWSQPSASGTAPPQVAYHSASLVENYMFVSFGNLTSGGSSSNVYVLDTSNNNYNWITSINANANNAANASAGNDSGNQSSSNVGLIVGVTIAGIVVLILLGGGLFWLYRRRKMSGVIETPGEFTDAGFNRRYETMNSATTSQTSYDLGRYLAPSNTEPDPSREFHPSYSHNFPVQHDPEIEDDDREFRVLPKELQPEYLEKYHNNNI